MILRISTTHEPASDLGYLLHKHPGRVHSAELPYGRAIVFFAEATDRRCTAVLSLHVDSVGMVRGKAEHVRWDQYVNDRPYASSSFLSTAMTEFFGTAMSGRCKERPELAATAIPLEFHLPVVRCRGGEGFLRRLFEPLGYSVDVERIEPYYSVRLSIAGTLQASLAHLYVLIPVMDDDKHYWVDRGEIDKLLRRGGDWLANHPEREEVARRYLLRERTLIREALARLDADEVEVIEERPRVTLHDIRLDAVAETLRSLGAKRVLDLGCGEGRLIQRLLKEPSFTEIVGMDVSVAALERANRKLRFDQMSDRQQSRVKLVHGSLTYRDRTLEGFDAAALVEVIEHLDLARLSGLERVVFEFARPTHVVVTTPNREYNALFPTLAEDAMRHQDHRFEWTRAEFAAWSEGIAGRFGYTVVTSPVGPEDPEFGAPSQMAVFSR